MPNAELNCTKQVSNFHRSHYTHIVVILQDSEPTPASAWCLGSQLGSWLCSSLGAKGTGSGHGCTE